MSSQVAVQKIPETLPELRTLLRGSIQAIADGSDEPIGDAFSLRDLAEGLVFSADLSDLDGSHIRATLDNDELTLQSRTCVRLISLQNFQTNTRIRPGTFLLQLGLRTKPGKYVNLGADDSGLERELRDSISRFTEEASRPKRSVFLHRALKAVLEMSEDATSRSLESAAAASTNIQVLLRVLEDPGIMKELMAESPLAHANLRGIEARRQLLTTHGYPMTAKDVADTLGISRQAVDKRRSSNRLIGVSSGRRGYQYPSWQFSPEGTLSGLEDVLKALKEFDAWMMLAFIVNPNAKLAGKSPLELLQNGEVTEVLSVADAYGSHGAD